MLPAAAVIIHSRDDRCRDESDMIQSPTAFQGDWDHGLHISITAFSL